VVSIVGPGGVGKTRLAVQVALDVMGEYGDGAWLVDLVPVTGSASLVRGVAGEMGVSEEVGRDMQEVLVEALHAKAALVILDNCEHILDDTAALAELLTQRCPDLTILTTSREPLDIDGEVVWRIDPLSVAAPNGSEGEAVQLFAERAVLAQPGFEITDENRPHVEEIVSHLGGMPLAIELAAAALSERSLAGVVSGLTDRFSLLTRGRRTAPDRHQTLRAALEWSLDLLDPEERLLFQRLSVFARSGTVEAAAEVCAGGPVPASAVTSLIGHLVRASLLTSDQENDDRWSMLESIRQLAVLELSNAGETEAIEERHRDWYMRRVVHVGEGIGRKDQARVMRELAVERSNIRLAIDGAVDAPDADVALRLCSAMAPFWTSHGDWAEGVDRLRSALDLDSGDPALCASAWLALGKLLLLSGDLSGAETCFEKARANASAGGDEVALARALAGAGYVAFRHSELDEAESLWAKALAMAEKLGEERVIAEVLRSFAIAVASKGDQARAGELLDRAMASARSAGDDQLLRLLLGSWAEMNLWLGRYLEAADAYGDALALATEIGDISARPLLLAELGWMALLSGDPVKAQELAAEATEFAEDLHSPRVLAHSLRLSGEALLRLGDHVGSGEALYRALGVAQELEAPAEVAGVLCSQAFRSLHLKDDQSAQKLAEEAFNLAGVGHTMRQVLPEWILGAVALNGADFAVAERNFREVLKTADRAQLARHKAWAVWGLAEVGAGRGAMSEAAGQHMDGLEIRIGIGDRLGIADSLVGLASVLRPDGVTELISAAVSIRSEAGAVATPYEVSRLAEEGVTGGLAEPIDINEVWERAMELATRKE